MTDFKVGDRVRVKGDTFAPDVEAGSVHVIDRVIDKPAIYRFVIAHDGINWPFLANELELITPQKEETVAFDDNNREKYNGKTVKVQRNHEEHDRPEDFAYVKSADGVFGVRRFAFDAREVPEVITALQSVYDDYQQMLKDAKPKVEDVLNGLGIGAVIRTLQGNHWIKVAYDLWNEGKGTDVHTSSVALVYSETVSEGVHLD